MANRNISVKTVADNLLATILRTTKNKPLKRKLNSNSYPQASLFILGLDLLVEGLRLVFINHDTSVFQQLTSCLTVKGEVGLIFCRVLRKRLYLSYGDIFHYLSKFI